MALQNVLVTGGAGFIGRHLVKSLAEKGSDVIVLDIAASGKIVGANAVYRKDIRDRDAVWDVIRKERIDTCIHLAAKVSVVDSVSNPAETLDVNINGTRCVLEACSQNHVQNFVFASSAAVYGEPLRLPLREDHVLRPLSPYGKSKVEGERLVAKYNADGKIKNAVTLRFFNVYGENQNPVYAGVISKFAERLSKGLPPLIYGDGRQTRDFIFVHDVVRAIELAAESNLSGVFNIATGKATSINELSKKMSTLFGFESKQTYRRRLSGDILHSYADIATTKDTLHFSAERDLDRGLKEMFRF